MWNVNARGTYAEVGASYAQWLAQTCLTPLACVLGAEHEDPVLDYELAEARTHTTCADKIIARIEELGLQCQWILGA